MTDKINNGGQAFPRPAVFTATLGLASIEQDGMTLRDYFAAKAMQGYLTHEQAANHIPVDSVARWSYEVADAMLRAREGA